MKALTCAVALAALAVAGSAAARPNYTTPSGKPDAVFPGMSAEVAQGKIASFCMDHGMAVASNSPGQVTCEVKMGLMQSVLSQVLIGNSYSTTPREFVRFTVVSLGADARAQGNAWIETQMAFGQVRQQPIEGEGMNDGMEGMLVQAGGQLPPGTLVRPGVAWLGYATGEVSQRTDGRKKISVWTVKSVDEGSPALKAGMQVGDVLTKFEGQTLKNDADLLNRLVDVRKSGRPTYDVAVERSGVEQTLTLENRERPPVGATTIASNSRPAPTNEAATVNP